MSGKSKREKKTEYQILREELGWSRAKAAETTYISENRLEKIETEKTIATPEDVVSMADAYHRPELCNYYCVNECAIGNRLGIPVMERKSLSKIVLEILTTLNRLDVEKNRLIEIASDEQISEDELEDFALIRKQLDDISAAADSLKLWISSEFVSDPIVRNTRGK